MTQDELKPCPFCGSEPFFSGDGDSWQDDRRYVQMELNCCVTMSSFIGWNEAKDMTTEEREKQLRSELTKCWNERANPEAYQAAALKRDAEIAALKASVFVAEEANEILRAGVKDLQELTGAIEPRFKFIRLEITDLQAEIAALKAELEAVKPALIDLVWQVEQFAAKYGEADFETYTANKALGRPVPKFIKSLDEAMQSGTTESPPSAE